ncbi:MAG: AIM24 family protein [Oscillospiraceae bacterium]|nr:AIM24 family protein [Oscillospiraceae bacterium]
MNYEKKYGAPFPVIEITLDQNETICIEPGTMVYSDPTLSFDTIHNSTRQKRMGGKKIGLFSQGNKVITMVQATQPSRIAIAPWKPGDIIELPCDDNSGQQWKIISGAFLACDMGVNFEMDQSAWSGMISGGIPITTLKTSGVGSCIIDSCGVLQKINLSGDKVINVDLNHLVAWSAGLTFRAFRTRNALWTDFTVQFSGAGSIILQSNCRTTPATK